MKIFPLLSNVYCLWPNANGSLIYNYEYWPYGEELTSATYNEDSYRYTGHGRDYDISKDYMISRHYSYIYAKFITPDRNRSQQNIENLLSWNLYSYVLNNPMLYKDPKGDKVCLANLTEEQQKQLLNSLSQATGDVYGVDENGYLYIIKKAETPLSETAANLINNLINLDEIISLVPIKGKEFGLADIKNFKIEINFDLFKKIKYGDVDPKAFNVGMHFMHESLHIIGGEQTGHGAIRLGPTVIKEIIDNLKKGMLPNDTVTQIMNQIRMELGTSLRASYWGLDKGIPFYIRPFIDNKVGWVKW